MQSRGIIVSTFVPELKDGIIKSHRKSLKSKGRNQQTANKNACS